MDPAQERAARRRASWTADIIVAGEPKGALYRDLTPEQRLEALAALNARVWAVAGVEPEVHPRSEWPGESFECSCHD